MKLETIASILLFFFGLMVQAAKAADIQIKGEFLSSQHARFTATAVGPTDIEVNGNVGVSGSVAADSFSGGGSALMNLDPANIAAGIANINISGNAATATIASSYLPWL